MYIRYNHKMYNIKYWYNIINYNNMIGEYEYEISIVQFVDH